MKKCLFILFCFLSTGKFSSQNYACDIKFTDKSLNYSFVQSYYEKDSEIESIIDFISTKVGLQPNFISISYPNYDNCAAINLNGFRYIIYDKAFLNSLSRNGNRKAILTSVIAHEIGHHLQGHTTNNTNIKNRKYDELEADKFAGYISAKMGNNLNDALSFISALNITDNSSTHPNKQDRLVAVKFGYELGSNEINQTIIKEKLSIENTILKKSDEYFFTAEELRQKGKYEEAIKLFVKSYALRDDVLPAILISQCYLAMKDYSNALKVLLDLEKTNRVNQKLIKDVLYYNLGFTYFNLSNFKKSIEYYKKALAEDSGDILVKAKLASSYFYNKEIQNASIIFKSSSFDNELQSSGLQDFSIADIYLEKGLVYEELKEISKAIDYYNKAEKIYSEGHPSKILAKFYTASAYNLVNDQERAITNFNLFIADYEKSRIAKSILKSQYIKANFMMADIYRDKFANTYEDGKRPEWEIIRQSSKYFINIIGIDDKNGLAYLGIGINWMADPSKQESACHMFQKACEMGEVKGCEFYKNSPECK